MTATIKPVPEGYETVIPYLVVDQAADVVDFLTRAFDAQTIMALRRSDGTVGHTELTVGRSTVMLSDATAEWAAMPARVFLYVDDVDARFALAIRSGGAPVMEPADTDHGDRMACVVDAGGNEWWIASRIENLSPDELQARLGERGA